MKSALKLYRDQCFVEIAAYRHKIHMHHGPVILNMIFVQEP